MLSSCPIILRPGGYTDPRYQTHSTALQNAHVDTWCCTKSETYCSTHVYHWKGHNQYFLSIQDYIRELNRRFESRVKDKPAIEWHAERPFHDHPSSLHPEPSVYQRTLSSKLYSFTKYLLRLFYTIQDWSTRRQDGSHYHLLEPWLFRSLFLVDLFRPLPRQCHHRSPIFVFISQRFRAPPGQIPLPVAVINQRCRLLRG